MPGMISSGSDYNSFQRDSLSPNREAPHSSHLLLFDIGQLQQRQKELSLLKMTWG
jgi:hypothetical protein